jgi:hypothetical protein
MRKSVFCCPATGQEIDPGLEAAGPDQSSTVHFTALHVRCPHCLEHHEIKIDGETLNEAA